MSVLFNDVVINKLSGGLGRRTPNQDMISGLLFNGKDATGPNLGGEPLKLENDKLYRLASLEDAESLGINRAYDNNGESAYYQISQFFRLNPSGDLFILKNDKAKTYAELVSYAKNMQELANGEIRQLAVIFQGEDKPKAKNDEYFSQVTKAVSAAKTVTNAAFANHQPLEIFLEAKGFDASKDSIDLRSYDASGVSVVVAMDKEKSLQDNYKNTAAVGVLLGAVSKAKVSENIAWIEKFNLSGEGFRSVGFVGGGQLTTEGVQKTLDTHKYIFSRSHTGIGGVYFNDSHTCTKETSDFTFIEANRTIHKAARSVRQALLPKVNAPVLVDPVNGTLPPSVIKGYETLCRAALERMISNGEVSQIDVFVNPQQNILATSELKIKIEVVPTGTARRITVDLGFKNPFAKGNS
ncbi:DUF2586 family protein [Tenacibaculum xiamenense]|uniref:DUF2586 family protein n=1 Tax=Tenacibaculum xiamenense TaxID=1261553 RepID=UPI0038953FC6